jgi:hypothetical protein
VNFAKSAVLSAALKAATNCAKPRSCRSFWYAASSDITSALPTPSVRDTAWLNSSYTYDCTRARLALSITAWLLASCGP